MISFKEENKKFNFRVGAVIINSDKKKVLLHTIKGFGFYLLPGGRVEWMENSINAIKRELEEEIALKNINPRPIAVYENFFNFKDVDFHEISNCFIVYLNKENANLEEKKIFTGVEGEKYIYEWFDIDKIDNLDIKPTILKTIIKNHTGSLSFYILDKNELID